MSVCSSFQNFDPSRTPKSFAVYYILLGMFALHGAESFHFIEK